MNIGAFMIAIIVFSNFYNQVSFASECEIKASRKSIRKGSVKVMPGILKNDSHVALKADEKLVFTVDSLGKEVAVVGPAEVVWKDLCGSPVVELNNGRMRMRSIRGSSESLKGKLQVKTRNAIMGVRGTDFIATFSSLLEESEIVVFDGLVSFESTQDPADQKEIKAGHWGGLGGRFGAKIGTPIALPKNVLDTFHWDTKW